MNDQLQSVVPKRYAGLVGLGLMFMWGSALMTWMNLWESTSLLMKTLGLLGLALVTASGLAIAFYTNGIEQELKEAIEQSQRNAEAAREYRNQAKNALDFIDSRKTGS